VLSALSGNFLGGRFEDAEPKPGPGRSLGLVQQRGLGPSAGVAQPRNLSRLERQSTNFRSGHGHADVSATVLPAFVVHEGFPSAILCKSSKFLKYRALGIA
jgi:hypothetical protein